MHCAHLESMVGRYTSPNCQSHGVFGIDLLSMAVLFHVLLLDQELTIDSSENGCSDLLFRTPPGLMSGTALEFAQGSKSIPFF